MYSTRCGIYSITHVKTGKQYIGSSVDTHVRFQTHRRELNEGSHHSRKLQNAWNKYGIHGFVFCVVETVLNADLLITREQEWLDELKPAYNMSPSAKSLRGFRHTQETRDRMSASATKRQSNSESRARMSESVRRMWGDPDIRRKKLETMSVTLRSPEIVRKCHAARKANYSETDRALQSQRVSEIMLRPGIRKSISKSNKKTWDSEELRARHRDIMKEISNRPEVIAKKSETRDSLKRKKSIQSTTDR